MKTWILMVALLLNIGFGSGREQTKTAGVDGPQAEIEVSRTDFGSGSTSVRSS